MTFDDDIDEFVSSLRFEREMSENTCLAYERDLRRFAAWLRKRGLGEPSAITRADIDAFLGDELSSGMSSATRCRRTAAIRMWIRHMKGRGRIKTDPTKLLDPPKKPAPLPKILTEEETFAMLDAVKDTDPRSLRDRAMLETLYGCGLRVSELCALRIDDFISEGELLRVVGKGAKERVVPVGPAAGRALRAYCESARDVFTRGDPGEPHVFVTRRGSPFTRQGVFKMIKERAAAVGIDQRRVSPHVLRHCFASHMLQHGADVRAIQEMLGHADIGTTQVYTHVDASRFRELHHRFHPRAERA